MADTTITPNMGLVVPTVGEDPGPDWANNINADLGTLDQHSHVSGQGVQITPAAININADLPFNSNNATLLNTVRFNNLTAPLAGAVPNLGCVYEAVNDLYFNDGVGNVIQLTKAGSVNSTSSGISNGTATASFVGGVLVVDSNVNTPANIQAGSIFLGNIVSGSNFAEVSAPSALAASYSLTVPPNNTSGSNSFLTYDTSNNMGVGPAVTGGITSTNIANQGVAQINLAARTLGQVVGAGGVAISPSSGLFSTTNHTGFDDITNCNITITTTGRPVMLLIIPDITVLGGIEVSGSGTGFFGYHNITLGTYPCQEAIPNDLTPFTSLMFLDTTVNGLPGTYNYAAALGATSGNTTLFQYGILMAYEI